MIEKLKSYRENIGVLTDYLGKKIKEGVLNRYILPSVSICTIDKNHPGCPPSGYPLFDIIKEYSFPIGIGIIFLGSLSYYYWKKKRS